MSRSGQVPIRMRVEGMRLVPASAFDQEALSSYQNGAVIQVSFWQGRNPDLLRKFWAILSKVVETCNTPWEDKEEAADALKLALGITDVGSTVNGQMFVRPGSIAFNALDEARFRKFFEDSMMILCRITGVDVEELGREAADTGPDHDLQTGEILDNTDTDETAPASSVDAGTQPAEGEVETPPAASPSNQTEREILISYARDMLPMAANTKVSPATLKEIEKGWAEDKLIGLSDASKEKARSISQSIRAIANNKVSLESAAEFHAEGLGCSPADIGGSANG
ncbi:MULTISPECIES: hypothetical protein [unclassified Rhizobium]|uniref:hypothetical protein n=1 Tax=unclassified Rhizobium TaxID=2613769 RepID=UPI00288B69B1|nr:MULTISPECIES: hypothetical protein [unclassified Rhizobium]